MEKRFVPQPVATKESVKPSATAFIALNVVRFLSIVALVLIFASQIVGATNDVEAYKESKLENVTHTAYVTDDLDCDYYEYSSVPDQPGGIFWAILNRTFIIIVILILLPTELVIPYKRLTQFYLDYVPIISPAHGLGILGVIQCWIASTVLSKYVMKFEQASGFLCFIVGCFNILMGLIFRSSAKRRRSLFSWENMAQLTPHTKAAHKVYTTYNDKFEIIRPFADVAVSAMTKNKPTTTTATHEVSHSSTDNLLHKDEVRSQTYTEPDVDRSRTRPSIDGEASGSKRFSRLAGAAFGNFGFGKQAQKPDGLKGLIITKPMETLPRYVPDAGLRH